MEKYAKKVAYNFEFTDTREDSIAESNKLFKLGTAMFKFYQGKELSLEQIELIANSSPAQQINGMNIVARAFFCLMAIIILFICLMIKIVIC